MGGHSVVPDRWHQTCYPNQLTTTRQLATTLRQLLDYYLLLSSNPTVVRMEDVCAPLYYCHVCCMLSVCCVYVICVILNVIWRVSAQVASANLSVHSLSPTLCCHLLSRLLSRLCHSPLVLIYMLVSVNI